MFYNNWLLLKKESESEGEENAGQGESAKQRASTVVITCHGESNHGCDYAKDFGFD